MQVVCLLIAGCSVIFLFGISSGGVAYDWDSAEVISFIVVGAVIFLAFVLWECYAKLAEPFVDMTLFRNGNRTTRAPIAKLS